MLRLFSAFFFAPSFLLIVGGLFLGCDADSPEQKPIRLLALGDSYTIGESVKQSESWPFLLLDSLKLNGISSDSPYVIAQTGWTTADLLDAVEAERLSTTFDWVILLIGVNDEFQGFSESEYRQGFQRLLKKALTLAANQPSRVIVISIPDYSVTPFAATADRESIRKRLDAFNTINREAALEESTMYVDVTPYSRLASEDEALLAKDKLHPSGKMYQLWVSALLSQFGRANP